MNSIILTIYPRYYIVFIVASIVGGTFYILYMPETKGMNLEEIAAVFGDVVVTEDTKPQEKIESVHVEDIEKGEP